MASRTRPWWPARARGLASALAAACLASACAGLPPPRLPVDGIASNYAGRFSLAVTRIEPGQPEHRDAWSGRFALAVGTQTLSLDLVSPLGATIARFETDPREARLLVPADGDVRVEHGPDPRSLAERVLGWSLPIEGMPDWIAGHPAEGRPFRSLPPQAEDGAGAPADRFEQDGWDVTVEPPQGERRGLRLQMSRAAQDHSPAIALRVVLDGPAAHAGAAAPAREPVTQ
jgi:outer membrane lipoprotein LolB